MLAKFVWEMARKCQHRLCAYVCVCVIALSLSSCWYYSWNSIWCQIERIRRFFSTVYQALSIKNIVREVYVRMYMDMDTDTSACTLHIISTETTRKCEINIWNVQLVAVPQFQRSATIMDKIKCTIQNSKIKAWSMVVTQEA